ncbi:hypothetical protein [Gordonia sp. OPL2]|uniref:hypothetical protein n=1 Tax=Gordonia sp. OPL2 TaxID=2486274 RepID=UPI0016563BA1|nr:hypothetical protein [Gordonia sp. OPL2]ROZ88066.1 hypothetical protein EEB19_22255 [Gordonia sp. OPL2]
MVNPSWIELVGRNYAAQMLYLSGQLTVSVDGHVEHYRFWHGPADQWRIDSDGDAVYVSAAGEAPVVRVDGRMQRSQGRVRVGRAAVSPLELFGPDTLLNRVMRTLQIRREPTPVDAGGRRSWSTLLGFGDSREETAVDIDDATGVLVGLRSATLALSVSELVEHDTVPANRFVWDGEVAPAPRTDRSDAGHADRQRRHRETVAATVAALDRPHEVLDVLLGAPDPQQARTALCALLEISEIGADAVEAMALRYFIPEFAGKLRGQLGDPGPGGAGT